MSGIPVVVVPFGGVPVRVVDSGAPVMTIATNGFGTPIAISDLGAPFVVEGLVIGPTMLVAPVLSTDIAYVGTTLTVSTGTWNGVAPITYSYQWQDTNGPVFVDILGENTNTYTTNAGDVGYRVRCEVIATDANGSTRAFSNITYAVSASVAPVNTVRPTISGTPRVGQTLTGSNGTWTGTPAPSFTRQWLRNGVAISGATGATYAITAADAGAEGISFRVRGTNLAGFAEATSNGIGPIPQAITNVTPPAVRLEVYYLVTTNGTWTGVPAPTLTRIWQRSADGISGWTNIAGQNSITYDLTMADVGQYVRSVVTASNSAGPLTISSNVFGPVAAATVWRWQSFTVRTGDSGAWIGFSNGDIVSPPFNPPVGTITREPTPITQLEAIFQDASGDIVAVLQGDWQAYVTNVSMTFDAEPLTYQGYSLQGGNTFMRFSGFSETLVVDTNYTVEFG